MNRSEMGQGVHTALAMLRRRRARRAALEGAARTGQFGEDKLYGNVALFMGSLWFNPRETEAGHETRAVRARANGHVEARANSASTRRAARRRSPTRGACCATRQRRHAPSCSAPRRCTGSCRSRSSKRRTASSATLRATAITTAHSPEAGRDAARNGHAEAPRTVDSHRHRRAAHRPRREDRRQCDVRHRRAIARPDLRRDPAQPDAGRQPGRGEFRSGDAERWRGRPRLHLGSVGGSTAALAIVRRTYWHALRRGSGAGGRIGNRACRPLKQRRDREPRWKPSRAMRQGAPWLRVPRRGRRRRGLKGAARSFEQFYSAPYLRMRRSSR